MSEDELKSENGDAEIAQPIPILATFTMLSDPGEIRPLLAHDGPASKTFTPPNTPLSGLRRSYLTIRQLEQCTILVEPESDSLSDVSEPLSPSHDMTPVDHCGPIRYPRERWKTFSALLFMVICMFCSTLALAIVHDRVPSQPPLPDVVFDVIPQWDIGLQISEYLIIASLWTTLILLFFHRYR